VVVRTNTVCQTELIFILRYKSRYMFRLFN